MCQNWYSIFGQCLDVVGFLIIAFEWFHQFKRDHDSAQTWSDKHGTHEKLLKRFWESVGFESGEFMTVGMAPKRAEWLRRVLNRLECRLWELPCCNAQKN
jgi:hypothetical protein